MRRAGVAGLVLVAGAIGAGAPGRGGRAIAHAAPGTAITAEGGAEVDSNVLRSETGSELRRAAAPVARLGAKLTRTGRLARGGYALAAGALARTVLSGASDLSSQNLLLLSGDLRWMRPLGERAVSVGFGLVGVDAIPLTDQVADSRAFRTLGGEGMLTLRGGEGRALTVALGGRDFAYKPDPTGSYDWRGPTGAVRLGLTLWERDDGARSVELAALLGFEARAYDSFANASGCAEDEPPALKCYAPTRLRRHDRFQRAGIELTWTGRFVAAAAYQLSVTDSNSYGQSIVRHRVTLSATRNLPWRLYGTALATLQVDKYPDGLPIERDLVTQTFTTLDDENRSSLQARIARHVGKAWAVESRAAIWRNLGGEIDTSFRRFLLYVGTVYNR
jgi:hypothetical protein